MALVTSQFDKNDKSVNALTSRNTVLNKEISAQKDKIETLKSALDNASTSFGENDKRTQEWQIKLNKAQAELNGMERELGDNNKALEKADKALDSAGKETDEFGKSVDKAGDEIDETGKETNKLGKEMDETSKKTSIFGDVLKATLLADAIKAGIITKSTKTTLEQLEKSKTNGKHKKKEYLIFDDETHTVWVSWWGEEINVAR
jgi:chromosome segregation ATPase